MVEQDIKKDGGTMEEPIIVINNDVEAFRYKPQKPQVLNKTMNEETVEDLGLLSNLVATCGITDQISADMTEMD